MNVLLFGPDQGGIRQRLETLISGRLQDVNVRQVHSKPDLYDIFSHPLNGIDVLVALIAAPADISPLDGLKPVLGDIRLILVLHGRSREILEAGLRLTPAFISYFDNDLMDIISVLKKMREKGKSGLRPRHPDRSDKLKVRECR